MTDETDKLPHQSHIYRANILLLGAHFLGISICILVSSTLTGLFSYNFDWGLFGWFFLSISVLGFLFLSCFFPIEVSIGNNVVIRTLIRKKTYQFDEIQKIRIFYDSTMMWMFWGDKQRAKSLTVITFSGFWPQSLFLISATIDGYKELTAVLQRAKDDANPTGEDTRR